MKKPESRRWFRRVRRSYVPVTWEGLCIYAIYALYLITIFVMWYEYGHELWNLLTNVIPLSIGAVLLIQFVASKNAK
jgi:hypothetical protein